jgi:protein-tyrosine-phosphatase
MAAAFFNRYADPAQARAISGGTQPGAQVHPVVVEAMREAGIDLASAQPRKLTPELASGAELLITMGCGEECPYVPGLQREDWPFPDPKGKDMETVRSIRDAIAGRVQELVREKGIGRSGASHASTQG